ncbi:MAG: hypothetical protein HY270_06900 [Deltaproteobacteria bacterium]|nr:hypothetical protein [Deltaproteobacteria bacterium]
MSTSTMTTLPAASPSNPTASMVTASTTMTMPIMPTIMPTTTLTGTTIAIFKPDGAHALHAHYQQPFHSVAKLAVAAIVGLTNVTSIASADLSVCAGPLVLVAQARAPPRTVIT